MRGITPAATATIHSERRKENMVAVKNKSAVGYIRVSHADQVRDGWSLSAQRDKIEAYCKFHDLELIEIIEDQGISGCNIKDRPGMKRLVELTTNGQKPIVQAIVTVRLDRLFRSVRDAANTSEIWHKRGVALHSIGEGVQTNGAAGKMFFSLLAVFAEFERNQASERIRAGQGKRKSSGLKLGGNVPFGYSTDLEGRLSKLESEQQIILLIKNMRTSGDSYRTIADKLNADSITTRSGSKWHHTYIAKIDKRVE